MPKTKLVLSFPSSLVNEPTISRLVRKHDVIVNILRASISPDEVGHMVVELEGPRESLEQSERYLIDCGVGVESLAQDVRWSDDRCTHCTACVSVCPTEALSVDRESMTVSFNEEQCIGCELCIPVCSYRAMEIHV
jgi:NAD-dependent dihydropyrimidine dehydrogenase PreA subunit